MPRRKLVKKKEVVPDPKYSSPLVTKFINSLMGGGKKMHLWHEMHSDGRLLASMLGTIRFSVGDSSPAIWIPRRALQREFELDYLFVLEGDSGAAVARRRRVKTRPVPFRPKCTIARSKPRWVRQCR